MKHAQTTNHILMIRPSRFSRNEETAKNNYYQKVLAEIPQEDIWTKAQQEFDDFVDILRAEGVDVIVVADEPEPETPDAVFPNNWVSFHDDGRVGMYPMFAENRRLERREEILEFLVDDHGFDIEEIEDFTDLEDQNAFMEGTGSLVLDRTNEVVYAALSDRTDEHAVVIFSEIFDMIPVTFTAFQTVKGFRLPIYHTNVMMCVGEKFAAICAECIDDARDRQRVLSKLKETGKEIVLLTEEQLVRFAGNMLQVKSADGSLRVVMSTSAYEVLTDEQRQIIQKHGKIVHSRLDIIEALGGGSARCMMCEIFLPKEG